MLRHCHFDLRRMERINFQVDEKTWRYSRRRTLIDNPKWTSWRTRTTSVRPILNTSQRNGQIFGQSNILHWFKDVQRWLFEIVSPSPYSPSLIDTYHVFYQLLTKNSSALQAETWPKALLPSPFMQLAAFKSVPLFWSTSSRVSPLNPNQSATIAPLGTVTGTGAIAGVVPNGSF